MARTESAPSPNPEIQGFLEKVLGPGQKPRAAELKEVNALYSLLENRYSKAVSSNPKSPGLGLDFVSPVH